MKVKIFYSEYKDKIVEVDDTIIHKIASDTFCGAEARQAVCNIENQLGDDCIVHGIWDEADENCLYEL